MSLIVSGATVVDGAAPRPLAGHSILIEGRRIAAVAPAAALEAQPNAHVVDARGKYVIPGLMNANVHLHFAISVERLARHSGRHEELILEAAQVALKSGLTTVFDTWGPRRPLMNARDLIAAGEVPGSRIFCNGNIIGFDGPLSQDFRATEGFGARPASDALIREVNSIWVENVGRHLMWLGPEEVAREVRAYIALGLDFLKYASNEHIGAFLAFSPAVQSAIVAEAHRAGLTAQAHCSTIEGLKLAIEAGCDIITHANYTGPTPIPESTMELFARRGVGAVIFPFTQRRLDWIFGQSGYAGYGADLVHTKYRAADRNARAFIRSGAMLMLANDATIMPPEVPMMGGDIDDPLDLANGHFLWLEAMEEKGCTGMDLLRAATRNIAAGYRMEEDLGTIEAGKLADIVILDRNPLESAKHYRGIHAIVKDGAVVDREALPVNPVLTGGAAAGVEDGAPYKPYVRAGAAPPMCACRAAGFAGFGA